MEMKDACLAKTADGDTESKLTEADVSLDDLQSQLHTQQVTDSTFCE